MGLQVNNESLVDNAPLLIIGDGTGQVRANVAGKPEAIGYMALAVVDGVNVKALSIDGVVPEPEHVADGSYRLREPLYLLTRASSDAAAKDFVEWVLSAEGQQHVADFGNVPVRN
jgi:phosphate transport system substrate-binding protein